jgi:hypothetical protein
MAITKELVYDRTEIVGVYKLVHCREATIVKEDGVEISRSFHRHVLEPSTCVKNEDGSFSHNDTDISGEPQETQDICAVVWTSAIKTAWKTLTESNLTPPSL